MATACSIKYHFLGFMSKCAEYGVTEPYTVGTLYKMALQRPVISRMGDTAGQNLGIENNQGRGPAIQGPGYYRPAAVVPRTPTAYGEEDIEYGKDLEEEQFPQPAPTAPKPAPVPIPPPTPEYDYPDFDPRGGYMAPYFAGTTISTQGAPLETGTADATTNLTINPADTQTDLQRQLMEEASN